DRFAGALKPSLADTLAHGRIAGAATPLHETSESDAERARRAQHMLREIVHLVGIGADVVIRNEPDATVLDLTGDDSGVLIGRRGQMLDALEYVVNRIVLKDQSDAARIIVDSQNYRERRRETLEDMARRMAE